jgi:hypothetical protein
MQASDATGPRLRASLLALVAALALGPALAGCETFGGFGRKAPTPAAPALRCPPSLKAEIPAEPLPPEGVDPADLPQALSAFLWGEWLPWAREGVNRLDQGRRWCLGREDGSEPPP